MPHDAASSRCRCVRCRRERGEVPPVKIPEWARTLVAEMGETNRANHEEVIRRCDQLGGEIAEIKATLSAMNSRSRGVGEAITATLETVTGKLERHAEDVREIVNNSNPWEDMFGAALRAVSPYMDRCWELVGPIVREVAVAVMTARERQAPARYEAYVRQVEEELRREREQREQQEGNSGRTAGTRPAPEPRPPSPG